MSGKLAHSPELDGIRAIAVLAVVLYHFNVATSFLAFDGKAGVTVFFALSGYLITRLLVEEAESTGSISIKNFYQRRFRRILPVSTLGVAAAFVVAIQFSGGGTKSEGSTPSASVASPTGVPTPETNPPPEHPSSAQLPSAVPSGTAKLVPSVTVPRATPTGKATGGVPGIGTTKPKKAPDPVHI